MEMVHVLTSMAKPTAIRTYVQMLPSSCSREAPEVFFHTHCPHQGYLWCAIVT